MVRQINFLGLGIEVGQVRAGLSISPYCAKKYFPMLKEIGLDLQDCGNIVSSAVSNSNKIFTNKDLAQFNWYSYKKAFVSIRKLLQQDKLLINWGGDHSVGISTVGGFRREYSNGYVVWIDAHADLNLPTSSITGNLHGMPMAILLNLDTVQEKEFAWLSGSYLDPSKLIYIGLRDVDPFEKEMIRLLGITSYDFEDIRCRGMGTIAAEVATIVGESPLHVSFDIDSVDPIFAPATGIWAPEGLTIRDLEILGASLLVKENLKSLDVVEINPCIGNSQQVKQTYFTAFNFLKTIQTSFNKGVSYDAINGSNQAKYEVEME